MSRIELKLPEKFLFSTTIPVRITDLNYGEHVGNDTIVSIIHEARVQFLNHFQFDEGKIVHTGIGLIQADLCIAYKREIFYPSVLKINICPTLYTKKGFELFYQIVDAQTEVEYARATTGLVCFDYKNRTPLPLPPELPIIWKF